LVPAFFLILLVGWVMDNLFIEEANDEVLEIPAVNGVPQQRPRPAAKVANKVVVPTRPVAAAAIKPSPAVAANGSVRPPKTGHAAPLKSPVMGPARKPAAGIRPPVSAARLPVQGGRPKSAGTPAGPAAKNPLGSIREGQPAKQPARQPVEKPVGKPGQNKEGL